MATPSHKQHYRLSPAAAALYVGPEGEVIVQLVDFYIRVQDGVTPGGFPAVSLQYITANFAPISLVAAISAVGFSGQYADILGSPVISTLGHSGQWADIIGKPSFATVATSGAYADLSGKPSLATVATSGAYGDLTGKPTLGSMSTRNVTIQNGGSASGGADGDVFFIW